MIYSRNYYCSGPIKLASTPFVHDPPEVVTMRVSEDRATREIDQTAETSDPRDAVYR